MPTSIIREHDFLYVFKNVGIREMKVTRERDHSKWCKEQPAHQNDRAVLNVYQKYRWNICEKLTDRNEEKYES